MKSRNIDLFIIGVQKGSTSSAINYLSQHPEIQTGLSYEFTYFLEESFTVEGLKSEYDRYFNNFDLFNKKIFLKNVGVINNEKSLIRIKQLYPNIKIVVLLRDPVERMYSSFLYARRRGWEDIKEFDKAIFTQERKFPSDLAKRNCNYINSSLYSEKIEKLFSIFPKEQIRIDISEEFNKNTISFLQEYLKMVNIKYSNFPFDLSKKFEAKKAPKSYFLAYFFDNILFKYSKILKPIIPLNFAGKVKRSLYSVNEKDINDTNKPDLSLYKYLFTEDVYKLESLLGRKIDVWKY